MSKTAIPNIKPRKRTEAYRKTTSHGTYRAKRKPNSPQVKGQ